MCSAIMNSDIVRIEKRCIKTNCARSLARVNFVSENSAYFLTFIEANQTKKIILVTPYSSYYDTNAPAIDFYVYR